MSYIKTIAELVAIFLIISSAIIFFVTFIIGAASQDNIEGRKPCNEINLNIEIYPPVWAACWFWRPVSN